MPKVLREAEMQMAAAATARAAKSTAARNKAGGIGAQGHASQGLYDPRNEHDACGVGFIANLKGEKSHQIVQTACRSLATSTHRGAVGADPLMGDGAGMLVQIPIASSARRWLAGGRAAEPGTYAVGFLFLPQDAEVRAGMEKIVEEVVASEGQVAARLARRAGRQLFPVQGARDRRDRAASSAGLHRSRQGHRDRRRIRAPAVHPAQGDLQPHLRLFQGPDNGFYVVSLSSRTIVYKGMFLAYQVGAYYKDLARSAFRDRR
jgi:glutamate synthase (NADPH/NADH) large chain